MENKFRVGMPVVVVSGIHMRSVYMGTVTNVLKNGRITIDRYGKRQFIVSHAGNSADPVTVHGYDQTTIYTADNPRAITIVNNCNKRNWRMNARAKIRSAFNNDDASDELIRSVLALIESAQ